MKDKIDLESRLTPREYPNMCEFYAPTPKMKNKEYGWWIIASTVAGAIETACKRPYTYKNLIADIEATVESGKYLDKHFIPMCQRQYFGKVGKLYNALISIELAAAVIGLYNLNDKQIRKLMSCMMAFDVNDYTEKYHQFKISQKRDSVLTKIEKLTPTLNPYVGSIETHEDKLIEKAASLRESATDAEIAMKHTLSSLGVDFIFQYPCNIGKDIIMDFYIPSKRVCIEVDGAYHDDFSQSQKDKIRDMDCALAGVIVLRISNYLALTSPEWLIEKLKALLC